MGVVLYAVTLGAASSWKRCCSGIRSVRGCSGAVRATTCSVATSAAALAPVVVFGISIPIAYFATSWGLLSWLLIFPLEWAIGHFVIPKDADPF